MLKNILLALLEDAKILALILGVGLIILAGTHAISWSSFRLELFDVGATRVVFLTVGVFIVLLSISSIFIKSFHTPFYRFVTIRRAGIEITFPENNQAIFGEF